MGGLLVLGIILTLVGLSIMTGLMNVLMNVTGYHLIVGGIIAAVAGGASIMFGGAASKVWGAGLIAVGFAVAVMGIIIKFVLHLWFVHWLINFGGTVMLVIGIIMTVLGLIGLLRDGGRKNYIQYGKGKRIYY